MSGSSIQTYPPLGPARRRNSAHVAPRARTACTSCRARKNRCIAPNGPPCANCVYENIPCFLLSKRHRKENEPSNASVLEASRSFSENPGQLARSLSITTSALGETNQDTPCPDGNSDIDWQDAALKTIPPALAQNSPNSPVPSLETSLPLGPSSLPDFLSPPPMHLTKGDLQYLHEKGALSLPEPGLRNALIESYMLYVHPCYPIIDVDALNEALYGGLREKRFSFLVFQAIMFTASCFVETKMLRKLGLLTRKAARNALFLKARLLYDLDYEGDRLCQVQALILMSTWWKTPVEQKDGWHWFGIALSVGRAIGLHRDINSQDLSPKARALRRRIWWSFIIRDAFASIATDHVPLIRDWDFAVAPLTLEDFGYDAYPGTTFEGRGVRRLDSQQEADINIQTVRICRLITQALLTVYQETTTGNLDIIFTNSISQHEPSRPKSHEIQEISTSLKRLLEDLHFHPDGHTIRPEDEHALQVHQALLAILCHYGQLLLHRERQPTERNAQEQLESRTKVRIAATHVNKILMDVYSADLTKNMPPTVVSCLIPVSISHMVDLKSDDPVHRRESRRHLEECKQVLRELADGHPAAEWAVSFLTYVETKVNTRPKLSNRPPERAREHLSFTSPGMREPPAGMHEKINAPSSFADEIIKAADPAFIPAADSTLLSYPVQPLDAMLRQTAEIDPAMDSIIRDPTFLSDFWNGVQKEHYNTTNLAWFDYEESQTTS